MSTTAIWEAQYVAQRGLRWWPSEELVRYVGTRWPDARARVNAPALEVGCGNGANLWFLAHSGFPTTGVDVSPAALELAAGHLARWRVRATLHEGDLLALPFADGEAGLVVDIQAIQHTTLTAHARAYGEVARVLRPGGRFFSVHLGAETWDAKHGCGALIDTDTYADMDEDALFPRSGVVCLTTSARLIAALDTAGLRVRSLRRTLRGYDDGRSAEYWIIEAER